MYGPNAGFVVPLNIRVSPARGHAASGPQFAAPGPQRKHHRKYAGPGRMRGPSVFFVNSACGQHPATSGAHAAACGPCPTCPEIDWDQAGVKLAQYVPACPPCPQTSCPDVSWDQGAAAIGQYLMQHLTPQPAPTPAPSQEEPFVHACPPGCEFDSMLNQCVCPVPQPMPVDDDEPEPDAPIFVTPDEPANGPVIDVPQEVIDEIIANGGNGTNSDIIEQIIDAIQGNNGGNGNGNGNGNAGNVVEQIIEAIHNGNANNAGNGNGNAAQIIEAINNSNTGNGGNANGPIVMLARAHRPRVRLARAQAPVVIRRAAAAGGMTYVCRPNW